MSKQTPKYIYEGKERDCSVSFFPEVSALAADSPQLAVPASEVGAGVTLSVRSDEVSAYSWHGCFAGVFITVYAEAKRVAVAVKHFICRSIHNFSATLFMRRPEVMRL